MSRITKLINMVTRMLRLWTNWRLKKRQIIWYLKLCLWSPKYHFIIKQKETYINWENKTHRTGLSIKIDRTSVNMKMISPIGSVINAIQLFLSLTYSLMTMKVELVHSLKLSMKIASYKISKKNSNIRQPYLLIIRRHNQ